MKQTIITFVVALFLVGCTPSTEAIQTEVICKAGYLVTVVQTEAGIVEVQMFENSSPPKPKTCNLSDSL